MKTILIGDSPGKIGRLKALLNQQGLDVTEVECDPVPETLIREPRQRLVVAGVDDFGGAALSACRQIRNGAVPGQMHVIAVASERAAVDAVGDETGAAVDQILREPAAEGDLVVAVRTALRTLGLEARLRDAENTIRSLSVTDPLTGSYSRQYLGEHLPHEIKRAARYGRSLSVIFCDVDRLEAINGVWGGGMGDRVLAETAGLLKSSIRRHIDWACRDEEDGFVIVLPETGPRGAHSLAERLRDRINGLQWEKEGADLRVTASFGYSGFPAGWGGSGDLTAAALLADTKSFLKEAQRSGLNQIAGGTLEDRQSREAV